MILVDVYVPSMDDSYDFWLDENTPVEKVIQEIGEVIARKMKSPAETNGAPFFLYQMERQTRLNNRKTLYENGVTDGHKLMLV